MGEIPSENHSELETGFNALPYSPYSHSPSLPLLSLPISSSLTSATIYMCNFSHHYMLSIIDSSLLPSLVTLHSCSTLSLALQFLLSPSFIHLPPFFPPPSLLPCPLHLPPFSSHSPPLPSSTSPPSPPFSPPPPPPSPLLIHLPPLHLTPFPPLYTIPYFFKICQLYLLKGC